MKLATLIVISMAVSAIAGPAFSANALVKCKLADVSEKSLSSPTFEILLHVKGSAGPGLATVDEGPELLEHRWEIGEPHMWMGPIYKVVRNDDLGILAASDYNLGNGKLFESAAFFYFDKRTGRAQIDEVDGADKKPVTEMGTCELVKQ